MEQYIQIQIDNSRYILKWIEGNPDSIENQNGFFINHPSKKPETLYNFDELSNNLNNQIVDCNNTLNHINIMTDLGFNTKQFLKDKTYSKLFYGCNLPSVTPKDKEYEPIWEEHELTEIINCINKVREIKRKIKESI